MLNRRITAFLLTGALALTTCGAAVFAAESGEDPVAPDQAQTIGQTLEQPEAETSRVSQDIKEEETAEPAAPAQPAEGTDRAPEGETGAEDYVPDAVGTVSFANLEARLRENNLNLLALEETIASIEAIDYEEMTDDVRKTLNQVADAQWGTINMGQSILEGLEQMEQAGKGHNLSDQDKFVLSTALSISGSSARQSLGQTYDSLRDTFEDLKEGKIQADNAAVVRQLRNAQNQVIMAAETLYVALVELELNDAALGRSQDALDRTVQEMELRYDFGQISALTLQEVKAGRTSLTSGRQTLDMNITNLKTQLEQLLGAELTGKLQLQALERVSGQQLSAMNLEQDLAAAKEASYDLFAARRTLDDAKEAYEEAGDEYNYNTKHYEYGMAQHTWQAAQYTYDATVQTFESSFRSLYNQVKDYQQVLAAAETALAVEKDSFAAAQLKYEQGTISKNALLTAQDELAAAQDTVDGAAIDLFTAYHNYRWAVDHGILN